jgi:flagellar biosynthetic protein FliP
VSVVRTTVTNRRFVRHFLEMLAAMGVGMVALMPLWGLAGLPDLRPHLELHALWMATTMTLGMSAWMAFRRHSVPAIAEMALAMYLPFVLLFVPYWADVLSGEAVIVAGHVLMLPAMVLAMVRRPAEYAGHRH